MTDPVLASVTALSDRVGAGLGTAFPRVAADPAVRQGQALLAVIDFLGEFDHLPMQPYIVIHGSDLSAGRANLDWHLTVPADDGSDLELAIAVRRAIGGLWDKQVCSDARPGRSRVYLRQSRPGLDLAIVTTVDCWPID